MKIGITGASNTAHPQSWARQLAQATTGEHDVAIAAHVGWGPLHQRKLLLQLPKPLDLLIASPSGNGIQDGVKPYMKRLRLYMQRAKDLDMAPRIYCLTISPRRQAELNAIAAELNAQIEAAYPHVVDIFTPLSADLDRFIGEDAGDHWTADGQRRVFELVRERIQP